MKTLKQAYAVFLENLTNNPAIQLVDDWSQTSLGEPSGRFISRKKESLEREAGIILSNTHMDYFSLVGVHLAWRSIDSEGIDTGAFGGFRLNGLTDAFLFYSDFWKGAFSLAPDVEVPESLKHFEQIGWFEQQIWDDAVRGCFLKQSGGFPSPIVLFRYDQYFPLTLTFEEYLLRMFETYAIKGWQYFYIDIPKNVVRSEIILNEMQTACELLPKLFPNQDWTYHLNKYQEIQLKWKKAK